MPTTHCSGCHFPELRRERRVQSSYLAFKGGSAEKHTALLQSVRPGGTGGWNQKMGTFSVFSSWRLGIWAWKNERERWVFFFLKLRQFHKVRICCLLCPLWSLADEVGVGVHFCHTMWLVVLMPTGSEPIGSSLRGQGHKECWLLLGERMGFYIPGNPS